MVVWLIPVWNFIKALWSNKTARTIILVLAVFAGTAFVSYNQGYQKREEIAKQDELKQTKADLKEYDRLVKEQIKADFERSERDAALMTKFAKNTQRINSVTTTLTGHVHELSEATSGVQLSVGAVRLLNDAKAGSSASTNAPGASTGAPYSNPAASDVGLRDLIQDGVLTAGQYNTMRERCSTLQTWVQRELVDENKRRIESHR
jgi:hypothetical protein